MSKVRKILVIAATALGGSTMFGGCGDFWSMEGFKGAILGVKGMGGPWWLDLVQDWLREDLFS